MYFILWNSALCVEDWVHIHTEIYARLLGCTLLSHGLFGSALACRATYMEILVLLQLLLCSQDQTTPDLPALSTG